MTNQIKKTEDTIHWVSIINSSDDKSLSIIEFERSLSLNQVFDKTPIINLVKKGEAKELGYIATIREIILNTASTLKFAENMTLSQATILASDVFDKMKYDTIDDICLMFKMARQGEFGSLKGRLDSDIINSIIIPSYLDKKSEVRERLQTNKATDLNEEDPEILNHNLQMLDRMVNHLVKERRKQKLNSFNSSEKQIDFFLEQAKRKCKLMSNEELTTEIRKAKYYMLDDFTKVYEMELENRNQ